MNLHLVGGFLGSGKTTAIIGAAKQLLAQGKRVGVVTNDQGRFLVDTAFFRLADVPTVEVTGGCFCCSYADLDARLEQIVTQSRPDAVFAESVGSCADLVATVVKPLLSLDGGRFAPSSFSVFVDARLLRRRLLGLEMPFSEDVVYIFDQQIAEAGLLVVNKADLLSPADLMKLGSLVADHFGGKTVLFQDSLSTRRSVWPYAPTGHVASTPSGRGGSPLQDASRRTAPTGHLPTESIFADPSASTGAAAHLSNEISGYTHITPPSISAVPTWVDRIENGALDLRPQPTLEMDYARYAAGEAGLAWLDEEIGLDGPAVSPFIRHFLGVLAARLGECGIPVGHIKLLLRSEGQPELKLSLTAGDLPALAWAEGLPDRPGPAWLILNARVQCPAPQLRQLVAQSLAAACAASGAAYTETSVSFFHPGFPNPTHRF